MSCVLACILGNAFVYSTFVAEIAKVAPYLTVFQYYYLDITGQELFQGVPWPVFRRPIRC